MIKINMELEDSANINELFDLFKEKIKHIEITRTGKGRKEIITDKKIIEFIELNKDLSSRDLAKEILDKFEKKYHYNTINRYRNKIK